MDDLQCFPPAFIRFVGALTGFAPGGLRDAERLYKKTTKRRARDARQERYNAGGLQHLKDEHRFLLTTDRPAVAEAVAWATSNGDRSENADYQYGKRRLRQIDGPIRFLTKRIDAAEVVDPKAPRAGQAETREFCGATVRYANAAGEERVVTIVGSDEVDLNRNHISWLSPLGRALMKSAAGDSVVPQGAGRDGIPDGAEVGYDRICVETVP